MAKSKAFFETSATETQKTHEVATTINPATQRRIPNAKNTTKAKVPLTGPIQAAVSVLQKCLDRRMPSGWRS